jgi:uncharacterized membrane protein YdbT with pleckstrin-like domain
MRCPQCGFDALPGAAFCSRCGSRVVAPRPAAVREYALTKIHPSWWRFTGALTLATIALCTAGWFVGQGRLELGGALLAIGLLIVGMTALSRRGLSWNLTSERLIEHRGLLSTRRRELELADIRSVEVDRRLFQKMLDLGNVTVASAASAEFLIRLEDISDPDAVAEALRKARLRRLS